MRQAPVRQNNPYPLSPDFLRYKKKILICDPHIATIPTRKIFGTMNKLWQQFAGRNNNSKYQIWPLNNLISRVSLSFSCTLVIRKHERFISVRNMPQNIQIPCELLNLQAPVSYSIAIWHHSLESIEWRIFSTFYCDFTQNHAS